MNWKQFYVHANLIVIAFGMLLFGYWYFLDGVWNPVITYQSNPQAIQTDKTTYHRGEMIYISFAYCKNRLIPASVSWRLVDGQILLFSPVIKSIPIGCYSTKDSNKTYVTGTIIIPSNVAPGTWHLEGEVSYVLNPIKTQTFERKSVDFQIIP